MRRGLLAERGHRTLDSHLGLGPRLRELILASGSPRRSELLALLGLPFRVKAVSVDERACVGERPEDMVTRLARAKALAVAALHPDALVLGCDTAVVLEGDVLGKPAGAEEARLMLSRLRDRTHVVCTGAAVVGGEQEVVEVAETVVTMRDYTDAELTAYAASGDPLDKAGAYAIQHPNFEPVARWEGCYATVVGLPLCHLVRALRSWSVVPPAIVPVACQTHIGVRCTVFPDILRRQRA